jgi:aminoglycoside phosphotransferase (APT) family kinase protein
MPIQENSSHKKILQKIAMLFPDVLIRDFESITKGYENDILIVNKALVFRISKNENRSYQKEIQLLDCLQSRTTVQIPQILFRSEDFCIMGYEIIPWEELTQEILSTFSQENHSILAKQIAEFLITLHSLSFDPEIQRLDFPRYHKIKHSWDRLKGFLQKEKDTKILAFAEKLAGEWNDYHENVEDIRLLHNDLFFKNIICDPQKNQLSGIIDFSDTVYGDFVLDFVALSFEDSDFTEEVMNTYELLSDIKIDRARVKLFTHTFALNELYFNDNHNKRIARRIVGTS